MARARERALPLLRPTGTVRDRARPADDMNRPRDDQVPPNTLGARFVEAMKAAGLIETLPEDVDKPWSDQRLRLTPLGEAHARQLRALRPELFREDVLS